MHTMRDGSEAQDRRLDRLVLFDEESRQYPIMMALPEEPQLQTKVWELNDYLDQGQEGACVGFGITHEFLAEPDAVDGLDGAFAREHIYWEAQKIDPWEGGSYPDASPRYEGTAVLAGMKVAQQLGYIAEYRWAFGVQDVVATLSNLGPVVFGLHWFEGMYNTDSNGFITPTGNKSGGHCLCGIGYDHEGGFVWLHNSWGPSWGVNGRAKILVEDLEKLLNQQGECAVPLVRRVEEPKDDDAGSATVSVQGTVTQGS